ncbi:MAG: hypothetical protein OXP36_04790 [Gammaproteobacteria bacterium]|nr:hypothetical protein [Gammaproteobacteria bacterium]
MTDFVQDLLETAGVEDRVAGEFKPVAKYYHAMDFLLYLREDCSYRADRVDPFLTVLYHPYEDRIVGIKLKGFRFLFDQFRKIVEHLDNEHFLPLVKFVEIALVAGVAEAFIAKNKERIEKSYADAKQLVEGVEFDHREVMRMVA